MARRWGPPLNGARYCCNRSKAEVHDLDNEKGVCQIDEIIRAGNAVPCDSLDVAHQAGYDNCHWCIGGSTR